MTAEEYRRAITRPAQRHGVTVEPELVDALVDEVTGQPGALPLLSTALVELWEAPHRPDHDPGVLPSHRWAAGRGGPAGRVGLHQPGPRPAAGRPPDVPAADRPRRRRHRGQAPGPAHRPRRRRGLLGPGRPARPTPAAHHRRRRRRGRPRGAAPRVAAVHDLAGGGPRRHPARAHLADTAAAWEAAAATTASSTEAPDSRPPWTGHRPRPGPLPGRAGVRHRQQHRSRTRRRPPTSPEPPPARTPGRRRRAPRPRPGRRGPGCRPVRPSRDAERRTRREQAAVSADARRVGARSQLTDDISLSLLLAAAGARLDDSPETRVEPARPRWPKRPHLVRSAPPGGGYLEVLDVSRDGRWIASSDDQNRMHLYDASTNRLLRSYDAGRPAEDEQGFMLAAFSPDSRQLAVILERRRSTEPVRLLDPNTMQPTTKLDFPGGKPVWGADVEFSADGRYLAATVHTVNWLERVSRRGPGLRGGLGPPLPVHAPRPGADRTPTPRRWRSARTAGSSTPS